MSEERIVGLLCFVTGLVLFVKARDNLDRWFGVIYWLCAFVLIV